MNHVPHALCNTVLTPAPGNEEDVEPLHVQRAIVDGCYETRSFWKPTPEELAMLNDGGVVVLAMLATRCPPVRLMVAEDMR